MERRPNEIDSASCAFKKSGKNLRIQELWLLSRDQHKVAKSNQILSPIEMKTESEGVLPPGTRNHKITRQDQAHGAMAADNIPM